MNIIEIARKSSTDYASLPALIDGANRLTHAQLWSRVDRFSQALLDRGLRKGDVVTAWLPNCAEAIEIELAVLQCGFIWVTLNARMTWAEVRGVIAACEPKILITDSEGLSRIERSANAIPHLILIDKQNGTQKNERCAPFEHDRYEDVIAKAKQETPKVEIHESDIARLRYTSGTTGTAKAAVLTHRVYLASLENLRHELHPLTPGDRVLHAAPLTHASGALIYPILAVGGANVVLPNFDTERVLDTIERERITTMFIVPTILQRLTQSPSFKTRDLSSLKTVMYGGAPIATEKLLPAIERLGARANRALVHIYGMTEAPYPITTLQREEHYLGNPRLGSIGKPTTICELEVRDEQGNPLGPDHVGEIFIRGRNVMSGYWKDPASTAQVLRDGWLASGDLGYFDRDGYFFIVDRKKDVIISGGFNVYATEVELALSEHAGIAEAAVIGLPHADWGEMVVACVTPKPGAHLDERQIAAWCRKRLSNYKCPKAVRIVDELPKNPAGKIQKKDLLNEWRDQPSLHDG